MGKPPLPFTRIRKNYIIIQNERYIVSIRYNNTFCVKTSEIQPLLEDNGKVRNYPVFPDDENRRFAVYYLELEEGSFWESEPHLKGAAEFITVFKGQVEIYADSQPFIVGQGESIRFRADTVHSYKNAGDGTAILHMIIYNP